MALFSFILTSPNKSRSVSALGRDRALIFLRTRDAKRRNGAGASRRGCCQHSGPLRLLQQSAISPVPRRALIRLTTSARGFRRKGKPLRFACGVKLWVRSSPPEERGCCCGLRLSVQPENQLLGRTQRGCTGALLCWDTSPCPRGGKPHPNPG